MTRGPNTQPTSRTLAFAVAGVNLLLCGAVAAALLLTRPGPPQTLDIGAATTSVPPAPTQETLPDEDEDGGDVWESEPPSTSSSSVERNDCEQISGPNGMTTCIPLGWSTSVAPGPAAMQADDPAGTSLQVRYGGSATSLTDTYETHADYERTFSANKVNYVSVRLESTTVRGMSAIDWEFTYDAASGPRHVRSVYWLAQGHEYFVYSAAPAALWARGQQILDVMLDTATP